MPTPILRTATSTDVLDVLRLLAQVPTWEEKNMDSWRRDLKEQEEHGDGAPHGVWVLEADGAVLGVATVKRGRRVPKTIDDRAWPVYLEYLIIDEHHRGGGRRYGARLEEHVMQELTQQGCSGAYLHVFKKDDGWEEALGFWECQGWEQAADSHPTHILMTKETAASAPESP
ncbi:MULTISPECIES: GNAT family N-acetyltransferase [Streptomyces]|nr:GNAT family N-acetyltransferase [Streptomyces sp. wa1063]WTE24079.1 GNAT family N-acetyltransferase [Streptomyces anulatus]WTE31212.1 GNAT family N-acetyltransferase [Streptomyces anulatus]